jgi:hypothetical protein
MIKAIPMVALANSHPMCAQKALASQSIFLSLHPYDALKRVDD